MKFTQTQRRFQILLVDDNVADIELTCQCFQETGIPCDLHALQDGDSALAFLKRVPPYEQSPRPDLILLDLNLPGTHGREILQILKLQPELQSIPVVVLTTSEADTDVAMAYRLHANAYHCKPVDLEDFLRLATSICEYWFRCATLPTTDQKR